MKKIEDPIVRTCTNCLLMRVEMTFIAHRVGVSVNPVPHNCPVAKGMKDTCQAGFTNSRIKELHHEVNFVRR